MSDIILKNVDDTDVVQYQPQGVCSKMMQIKIKDEIIFDIEIVGGCNGNLSGISNLVKGMKVKEVISRLAGIPCGSRATSCPDQLAHALNSYIEVKETVKL